MSPLYARRTEELPKQLPQELLDEVRENLQVKQSPSPPIGTIGEDEEQGVRGPGSRLEYMTGTKLTLNIIKKNLFDEIYIKNISYPKRASGSHPITPVYLPKGSIPNWGGSP